jgi:hypothetical protein
VKNTDRDKVAQATLDLKAFRAGTLAVLPDIRDVFSEAARIGMSHRPKPGLDGRAILVQTCTQCHNARLDPTVSRARFDTAKLDELTEAERQKVIDRLILPKEDRGVMPPHLFRELSPEEIALAIDFLRAR